MKNLCERCEYLLHIKFETGQEIRRCRRHDLNLYSGVLECSDFTEKNIIKATMERWELMEYINHITPYIIERKPKRKSGFLSEDEVETIVRRATKKDKGYDDE